MKRLTAAVVLGAVAMATGGLPAQAGSTASAAACTMDLGSVTAAGDHTSQLLTATKPPTAASPSAVKGVYPAGSARLSSSYTYQSNANRAEIEGYVVLGDAMYSSYYATTPEGQIDPEDPPVLKRVGGGWGSFTAFERSDWAATEFGAHRYTKYGLRNDGTLFRWTTGNNGLWHTAGAAGGFSAVKAMTLISKTATYDTFLANLRGGALYTIHIPVSSPM
jgi:hypothetical protein